MRKLARQGGDIDGRGRQQHPPRSHGPGSGKGQRKSRTRAGKLSRLGAATVNLRIRFWVNGHEHSIFKVRSSVIRLMKHAFQNSGISMPDESHEVIFPQGVHVTMLHAPPTTARDASPTSMKDEGPAPQSDEPQQISAPAESGFASDADVLEAQARQAKPLDKHASLLLPPPTD